MVHDAYTNELPIANYFQNQPQQYVIDPLSQVSNAKDGLTFNIGMSAALTTVKFDTGYSLFWNIQNYYDIDIPDGWTLQQWFAPNWVLPSENTYPETEADSAANWYFNLVCEDKSTNGSDEKFDYDNHDQWTGAFYSNYDLNQRVTNSSAIHPEDNSPLNVDIWQTSVLNNYIVLNDDIPNIDGFFQHSCIGYRDLAWDDRILQTIFYNSSFTFRAGWKLFDEQGNTWAESNATKPFTYKFVDSAFDINLPYTQPQPASPINVAIRNLLFNTTSQKITSDAPQTYIVSDFNRTGVHSEVYFDGQIAQTVSIQTANVSGQTWLFWEVQTNFDQIDILQSEWTSSSYTVESWFSATWFGNQWTTFVCSTNLGLDVYNSKSLNTDTTSYRKLHQKDPNIMSLSNWTDILNKSVLFESNNTYMFNQIGAADIFLVSSTRCSGARLIESDSFLSKLKLGDTFQFTAGMQFLNVEDPESPYIMFQSTPQKYPFTYQVGGSSPQSSVNNAFNVWSNFTASQTGLFDYFVGIPQTYTINKWGSSTASLITTMNIAKVPSGHSLFWNVQSNFAQAPVINMTIEIWFSPIGWLSTSSSSYVNFLCTDSLVVRQNISTHSWNYTVSNSTVDLSRNVNRSFEQRQNQTIIRDTNIWMQGASQFNPSDDIPYSFSCMGTRELSKNITAFKSLKYEDTINFTAGYKQFQANGQVIQQSTRSVSPFSFKMVDIAVESAQQQPFFQTVNQQVQDFSVVYVNNMIEKFGRLDYHANLDGAQIYTISNYSNNIGYLSQIALSVFKLGQNYVVAWNIKTDFRDQQVPGLVQQVWFSPQWIAANNTLTTRFAPIPVNFICQNTIGGKNNNITNNWAYIQSFGYKDLNTFTSHSKDLNTGTNLSTALDPSIILLNAGQTNGPDIESSFTSFYCQGLRSLNETKTIFKQVEIGEFFSFKAGWKVFGKNGSQVIAQSKLTQTYSYQIMDSSLTNNLPDPVVNFTDATDPFDLYKATLGRVLFFKGTPKLYTIEPYVYSKRAGLVAALSLAKFTTGYFILWNVQVNTNELLDSDATALTFFTPTWYASSAKNTTQLNFICQNQIRSSPAYIDEENPWVQYIWQQDWTYKTTYGIKNISDPVTWLNQTLTGTIDANISGIWMRGTDSPELVYPVYTIDTMSNQEYQTAMFQTGCNGARNLNNSDTSLKHMKYNDTMTFTAGYKIFKEEQIVVQSGRSPVLNYTAVDVALINSQFIYIDQPNATDGFNIFSDSYILTFGPQDFAKSVPQNFTITKFSPQINFGSTASVILIKIMNNNGWALAWNTQVNTKEAPIESRMVYTWFSPFWDPNSQTKAINFVCQQYHYKDADSDLLVNQCDNFVYTADQTKDLSTPTDISWSWYLFEEGNNYIWPISIAQKEIAANITIPDANGYYTYGCTGSRLLVLNDNDLKTLKYGDSFQFKAGYKVFDNWGGEIVVQSPSVQFNYNIVDNALLNYSFPIVQQQNASDSATTMMSLFQRNYGAVDYYAGIPKNYTVELFSNKSGTGLVVSITLIKVQSRGYILNWNSQVNYLRPWNQDSQSDLSWFSAMWDRNTTNYVHSMCYHSSQLDESQPPQRLLYAYSGFLVGKDLGQLDFSGEWPNSLADWVDSSLYTSITINPLGSNEEKVSSSSPFSTKCMGSRLLWQNDAALKPLQYNQNFTFTAGYKFYYENHRAIASSIITSQQNYSVVDLAVAKYNINSTPQVNASHPGPVWQAANYFGLQDQFIQKNPQNYTINDFSSKAGFGMTLAMALTKYPEGYGLLWNTQLNYRQDSYARMANGAKVEWFTMWFSPQWDSQANSNINFLCTDYIMIDQSTEEVVSKVTANRQNRKGSQAIINQIKANQTVSDESPYAQNWNHHRANKTYPTTQNKPFVKETQINKNKTKKQNKTRQLQSRSQQNYIHNWVYEIRRSAQGIDLNSLNLGYDDIYQIYNLSENLQVNWVWQKGIDETRNITSGVSSTSCMGHRPLYQNDPQLKPLKYGDTFSFRAGYKFYEITGEWQQIMVSQSYPSTVPFNYTLVDTAFATSSVWNTTFIQPNASDALQEYRSLNLNLYGAQAYFIGRPTNYTINFFSNYTQMGVVAEIQLAKYPDGYGLYWSVQHNSKQQQLPDGVEYWTWFSPKWLQGTNNNSYIHFVCKTGPYNDQFIVINQNDLNLDISSQTDFFEKVTQESDFDVSVSDIWINPFKSNVPTQGFDITGCMGGRLLQNSDSQFKPLKYGDTFAFRAGYKIFDVYQNIFAQSFATSNDFNYTIVDSSLAKQNFNIMQQSNASDVFSNFRTYYEQIYGKQDMQKGIPQNFTIQSMNNITKFGLVAGITLVKLRDGYYLLWNVQMNSNYQMEDENLIQIWFSPQWMASSNTSYVNIVCQLQDANNSTYHQSMSTRDINKLVQNGWDTFDDTTGQPPMKVWQQITNQTTATIQGHSSIGCMGGLSLQYSDSAFKPLKFGDRFTFTAGYKLFTEADHRQQPISQSTLGNLTNYVIADTALAAFQFSNFSQLNASTVTQLFSPFDLQKFGSRDYIFNAPKQYLVNPMSNYTRAGLVTAIQLAKYLDGYALLWSVSVNTLDPLKIDQQILSWFSPSWLVGKTTTAAPLPINFLCQLGLFKGTNGETISYQKQQVITSPNDLNTPVTKYSEFISGSWQIKTNAWMSQTNQTFISNASVTNRGMYQTSCMGARYLQYNDAAFKPLKYGESFTFKAGYKIFGQQGEQVLLQSYSNLFNHSIVDTTIELINPIRPVPQPPAQDGFIPYQKLYQDKAGMFEYRIGGLRNFTINEFSNATGYGLVATISMSRVQSAYTVHWNVQANYYKPLGSGMMTQIWFAPLFESNQNFVNLVCEQYMDSPTTYNVISIGSQDLNNPSNTPSETYASTQILDQNKLQTIFWQGTSQFNVTNTTRASSCWGTKLLSVQENNYVSFRTLKYGDTFSFRAGYKVFNGTQIVAQSYITNRIFNYTLVDTVLASNLTPVAMPQAPDSWFAYFPLLNSSFGDPKLSQTSQIKTNSTINNTAGATFYYQRSLPQQFNLTNFGNITGFGSVATLNSIKYAQGWGITWNIQTNYKQSLTNGTVIQIFFSPDWGSTPVNGTRNFINYICQDDILATVTPGKPATKATQVCTTTFVSGKNVTTCIITANATNSTIQTQNLTHKWSYLVANTSQSISSTIYSTFQELINGIASQQQYFNDSWIQGSPQNNSADSLGWFQTGCMGARPFYNADFRLRNIKLGDSISFNGGFKVFQRSAFDAQLNFPIINSLSNQQQFSFQVVDSAVKRIGDISEDEICEGQCFDSNCVQENCNLFASNKKTAGFRL